LNIQEIINQVLEHLRGAWRFRWLAFAVAALVCTLGWAVVLRLPDQYGADARVFVDTQTMLSEVTRGLTLDANVDTQISRVRQMMLSAPQLLRVGEETGLLPPNLAKGEQQRLIGELQQQIVIRGAGTGGSGSVYTIAYQNPDRDLALRVVGNLLNVFVEGTRGGKRSGSEKAQEFLASQIAEYEKRLSTAETRLADFKKQYVGLMPGSQGDYFTRLQNEMTAMQKAERELSLALQERATMQRQLNGQQPFVSTEQSAVVRASVANSATSLRLRETQSRLDETLLRFTDKHPEVVGLRETIKDLEQRLKDEVAAAEKGNSGAAASAGLAANPVYQQIQTSSNENEVRISSLQADLANRRTEVDKLRALVDVAPNIEAKFSQLNRDYQITQEAYQALVERMERTRLGEEAEEKGVVQFEVMDPPAASFYPVAPNRPPLIAGVLVLALGAGGGLAFLLHLLKPVYFTRAGLEAATGLPVVGVIPRTWLDRHRNAFRRSVIKYAGAVGCLVIVAVFVISQASMLTRFAQGILL
jgi:polysaccharide chain length determinant protein (PEP-CTERM system associated)